MLCIIRYPDSHKEDVHKFYFPWSRFINSSSKVWFILPLTGIFWKNSELFFPVLSPSNQNSAFWRFLPYCSLGLFSLLHSKSRSRQSPGELSFFQPLECLKTSCWFHMLKKKKRKGRGRMGMAWLCLWLSGIHSNGLLGVMAPID